MNTPYGNSTPLTVKLPPISTPPVASVMSGLRNASPNEETSAVIAAPITTATASSTTLPRIRKSLKPRIMPRVSHSRASVHVSRFPVSEQSTRSDCGAGDRPAGRTTPVRSP